MEPLVVKINPANGTATIPKVTFGKYSAGGSQYTAEAVNAKDVAGYVFSCTGYITLTIDITGGGTDYGPNRLILQKQYYNIVSRFLQRRKRDFMLEEDFFLKNIVKKNDRIKKTRTLIIQS